jgi:putative ABC transport system permease protein
MNFRDFRIGWRLLIKEPSYSAVVVLGLSIGFAACMLLLAFVRYSLSYDATVPQVDNVYLIKCRINAGKPMWFEATPAQFLNVARNSGMVEAGTIVHPLPSVMTVGAQVSKQVALFAVDPVFASMFGVHALEGDLELALNRPDTLALTLSQARLLFAEDHVLGRTVQIGGKAFQVAAVLPDPPSNSSITYAALTGVKSAAWPADQRDGMLQSWGRSGGGKLYVNLKPGVTPDAISKVLQDASDHSPIRSELPPDMLKDLAGKALFDVRLIGLRDVYFDRDTAGSPFSGEHGDLTSVYGLAAVAALILLLAVTNYVSMATVHTLRRQREIALRKLLGASVGRLNRQFFAESLCVSMGATVLGLLMAGFLLPTFADLVGRKLDNLLTVLNISVALGIGALVGVVSGIYPAWLATGVRPHQTLTGRGTSETAGGLRMRRGLTVLQFSAAMALTGASLAIAWQTYFASHASPGFDDKPMLVLELPHGPTGAATRGLREALANQAGVAGVAGAQDLVVGRPFHGNSELVSRNDGKPVTLPLAGVTSNYFDVLAVRAQAGRLFSASTDQEDAPSVVVLNVRASKELGFATPELAVGQLVTLGGGPAARSMRVVGIAPDIRYESLREAAAPMVYLPSSQITVLTVRANGQLTALERQADSLQRQYFPNDSISVRRMDSFFAESYAEDLRLAKMLALSSMFAIGIAAFGIYVLSAYNVQRLTRQIVLRRLYGADRMAIARLVARDSLGVIAVGALIGLPLAGLSNYRYLAGFVEKAPMGLWPLALALLVAGLVAGAATVRQTLGALGMKPAAALRTE